MRTVIRENTWLNSGNVILGITMDYGWGNGYVLIPKDHPLHGKSYDDIHELIPDLNVNGGLTYSSLVTEGWNKE